MNYLTVFSAPKPFTDPHINMIQRNAIQSWMRLGPQVNVLLIGQEPGLAEAAAEYGVALLTDVRRNDSGTPLISSIFGLARQAGDSPFLAFVNGDILLLPEIVQAAQQVAAQVSGPFLLIGQRWDLDVSQPLDFSDGWPERLRQEALRRGRLHRPAGSDYFVFPRHAFQEMPDFAVGRAGWDNWMIYHARRMGWPVIDGTQDVMIIHQAHDYSHLPGGQPHYNLDESQRNMALAGGFSTMYMVLDANRELVNGRVRRARLTPMRMVRAVERWLTPKEGGLRGFRGALARRFRRLRRRYYG
ncbi:MAG: hypothetical protein QME21_01205 [Anaerolineales bacterium]|nr:hypothetical protein [Anaerolineales bacterium]